MLYPAQGALCLACSPPAPRDGPKPCPALAAEEENKELKEEEEGKGWPGGRWQYPAWGVGAGPVQLQDVSGLLHTGRGVTRLGARHELRVWRASTPV